MSTRSAVRGMTLVDVVVGVGVMLVIFLSIFGAFKIAIDLVFSTKAKAGGVALTTQQMEYIRGLAYDAIGTVGGIPSGSIPQLQQQSVNGIQYTVRTLVLYVDAPEDGTGGSDSTGVTADYKLIKVETLWSIRGSSRSTFAVSRVSPHGVEALTNGGTLRVNVFDALAAPVGDATVRIQNASTSPAIDVSIDTDSQGSIIIPGAPPASNYKISVTKGGYSSAQTYDTTTANPNPNPAHVSIVNQQTTTISFAIDRTGSLAVSTWSPIGVSSFTDTFTDQSKLSATTSTTVEGGELKLYDDGFGYALSGTALSSSVTPNYLASWDTVTWSATTSAEITARVHVYYLSNDQYVLVPDADLPGNGVGFTSSPVSLVTVIPSSYPSLKIGAVLATTNASSTPVIGDWTLNYRAGPTPLPNIQFTTRGAKTIGQTNAGVPIYKFSQTNTTSGEGTYTIQPMEWDSYAMEIGGSTYDVSEQCPDPLAVAPSESKSVSLMLVPKTTNSLRVTASSAGVALSGATVALVGSTNATSTSSTCGQAFFSGLSSGAYTLTVSKSGLQTAQESISVSGATLVPVTLSP